MKLIRTKESDEMDTIRSSIVVCLLLVSGVTSTPASTLQQNSNEKSQRLQISTSNPLKVNEYVEETLKKSITVLSTRRNEIKQAVRSTTVLSQQQTKYFQEEKRLNTSMKKQNFQELLQFLNSTEENPMVREILDRIKKNYEKLQNILRNKTSTTKNEIQTQSFNKAKDDHNKIRRKRSVSETLPEITDVEYLKYGGYISTKVYQPLGATEASTNSNVNESYETRIVNLEDQIVPSESFVSKINFHDSVDSSSSLKKQSKNINNDSSTFVGRKTQFPKPDVKERFIKLFDEYVESKINQQQNINKHSLVPTETKINSSEAVIQQKNNIELPADSEQSRTNKILLAGDSFNSSGAGEKTQPFSLSDLKSKVSVNQYQIRFSVGDFQIQKKTSVVSVKQPIEQIDVQTLNSKTQLENSNSFSPEKIAPLVTSEAGDLLLLKRENIAPTIEIVPQQPLSQNVSKENFDKNRNDRYQIVESKVSELARKLMENFK